MKRRSKKTSTLTRRRQPKPLVQAREPISLRHVEEEELESALSSAISFFATNPDMGEVAVMGEINHVATFKESGRKGPENKGLIMTMRDGSEFELTLMRSRGPEFEHEDELL